MSMTASTVLYYEWRIAETGELPGNALAMGNPFWLSVGCIPMLNGNIYCLDDVGEIVNEKDQQTPHV
ncbi:uncharacterized protein N7500_000099 [Penicillium coprophilum]|uniref:uncharacterized protein n=1 Tax=Penicillium coprophilum TaxID=36646 RepID=UPI00239B616F|nr:uncharacterized protein N7500_000099 [Penicillium coprophilum]KAJ5177400.1 hypothetical protein N7500_000099 [Penicillium coprophilum]